ncbi:MAG: dynamin family protein, partial [Pseudomonadota bacterium]
MSQLQLSSLEERLHRLETHLQRENPVLLEVVKAFRQLDQVTHRLGLTEPNESLASQVSWFPVVALLGTFSAGKSTFVNSYLGQRLQLTGNQAVDDKFTVVCYGPNEKPQVLPGLALDSDPRFPFYKISQQIEEVSDGDAERMDAFLQLKACNSESIRGKILIDSPGFDSDEQRAATLAIIEHIIDLADLVLVFFDARHPEPGAMQQTLKHLVGDVKDRPDFNKFMYILNQVDATAREDNPEEVFAAWQRALASQGLTAGRFYRIYDVASALPIEDEALAARFEAKRKVDADEISLRLERVEVERAYRVTGALERTARAVRDDMMPTVREARRWWKRRSIILDGIVLGGLTLAAFAASVVFGWWEGVTLTPPWTSLTERFPLANWILLAILLAVLGYLHVVLRRVASRQTVKHYGEKLEGNPHKSWILNAIGKNTSGWMLAVADQPIGWGPLTRRKLDTVLANAGRF